MLRFNKLVLTIGLVIIILLIIFMKYKKGRSKIYLVFFFIFYVYLLFVIKYTIFPIPLDMGDIFILESRFFYNTNFILFGDLTFKSLFKSQVLLNILLSMPFGFGISFIMRINRKKLINLAILFGVFIESLQLIISLFLGFLYRVVDINDVFFNFVGVILGYIIFKIFSILYIRLIKDSKLKNIGIFKYVYRVVQNEFGQI
jgi:glycopeptide antibiotics resistance protein